MTDKDVLDDQGPKKSEQEFKPNDIHYRRLFETSKDGILIIDAETGTVLDMNPFFEKTLGYPRREILNKAIWDLGFLKSVFTDKTKLTEFQQQEYIHYDDLPLATLDGRNIDVEIIGSSYNIEHQKMIQLNIRNIGERKVAEKKLKESEERFRHVFDMSPISAAITSLDLHFTRVNEQMCRMLGYTEQELMRLSVADITYPEDLTKEKEGISRLAGGQVQQYVTDKRYVRKDGSIVWGHLSVSAVRDGEGHPLYYLPMIEDITERKKVEEEKDMRSMLLDIVSDSVFLSEYDGTILFLNENAYKTRGYAREDLLGSNIRKLRPVGDVADWDEKRQEIVKYGQMIYETAHQCRNGEVFPIEVNARSIELNGKTLILSVIRDITDRRQEQVELQKLSDKAEMSSRLAAVGEMAAGIAHEINNPLTGVIGFSELLLENNDLPENVKEDIKVIHDGSIRVKEIVSRMLTFARQTKPNKSSVSVAELLDNTLELRSYVLKTSNIEVIRDYDPQLPWVTADAGQLQQVFLNIIVNAEYAMKKANGRGMLTVKTEALDDHIRISISDNGPGMSDEIKAKLFQPFFTTKDPGEGTGLGLSLSHGIIEEHDGSIRAESKVGQGTTFIIELPITPEEIEPVIPPPVAHVDQPIKRARILVVDDEPTVRALIKAILTQDGHRVEECDNSAQVLEKLKGTTFDILLVDLRMPGMNGMELYGEISTRWPKLAHRVIFVTGDTSDLNTREYLATHQIPFITKPFDRKTLEEKVNSVLQGN